MLEGAVGARDERRSVGRNSSSACGAQDVWGAGLASAREMLVGSGGVLGEGGLGTGGAGMNKAWERGRGPGF